MRGSTNVKISSKAIAMGLIYYESASKNILMSTFWGDSENIDFFIKVWFNNIFVKLEITKISSKAIAMGPIYYESASKNIYMSTFWGDSENIDFFIKVCLNLIFIKLQNHENIIESDCHETYILWISIEKYTYEHILRGFWEHWFFHQGLLEPYLYKAPKSRKYHRKRLLWDLYIMNQHQKIYIWVHLQGFWRIF